MNLRHTLYPDHHAQPDIRFSDMSGFAYFRAGMAQASKRDMTDTKSTLGFLKATAAAQVAKYPQYAGHFERYILVRIKRDVRTKMGLAFIAGEFAIAVERDITHPLFIAGPRRCVTVWSRHNACDTAVKASDVEVVS